MDFDMPADDDPGLGAALPNLLHLVVCLLVARGVRLFVRRPPRDREAVLLVGLAGAITEWSKTYTDFSGRSYKTVLADGRVVLNVAGFYDVHKDIQLSIFRATGAAASVIRNAASADIKGIEIETVVQPFDGLTINGSLAFLDSKYNSYIDGGVDVSDNRAFPHTPKFSATMGFDWRVVEGNWGSVNLSGDVNHVSGYYAFPYPLNVPTASDQNAGNSRSPGRTIVNLRVAVSDVEMGGTTWEVAGFVRNLTQEDSPSNFIDFGPGFGGLTLGYFPDPRTWGVTVGTKF